MSKALTLTDALAREIYPKAEPGLKAALDNSWGADFFKEKITDRVKTVEDACRVLGVDYGSLMRLHSCFDADTAAYEKLKVVVKALNEGWVPDWNNSSQAKWYPWFKMYTDNSNPSGFGFCLALYDYAGSYVGSRLALKSRELAEYVGKQFPGLYRTLFHF